MILVFSLENEASFQELYQRYRQLSEYRTDIPVIVVGTQGQPERRSRVDLLILGINRSELADSQTDAMSNHNPVKVSRLSNE